MTWAGECRDFATVRRAEDFAPPSADPAFGLTVGFLRSLLKLTQMDDNMESGRRAVKAEALFFVI
jgi:hypothetical protein